MNPWRWLFGAKVRRPETTGGYASSGRPATDLRPPPAGRPPGAPPTTRPDPWIPRAPAEARPVEESEVMAPNMTTVKVGVDATELEAAVALAKELGERLEAARELLVECLDMQRRLTAGEAPSA